MKRSNCNEALMHAGCWPLATTHPTTHTNNPCLPADAPRRYSYILLGVFHAADAYLYVCAAAACIAGTFAGNALSGRLDQKGFSRVLVLLMCICCLLLFAAAAGLTGR